MSTSLYKNPEMIVGCSNGWFSATKRYVIAALACAVFSGIYESFSHGVYSPWMVYLFAFPLVLGALPSFVFVRLAVPDNNVACRLLAAGVITLGLGSCLCGVLEIYGTSSVLVLPYLPLGAILYLVGLIHAK